ncbi:hypothetical protein FG93_03907 [Bosea sp. LC85]|uniref:hypothetical protein n=1 Tax=Bosea sp. LC85 TaxID=1502851 RepID=UPI0004E2BD04|nr:hypothetical protein FG93_03907 [Bosea sp. LC85]
MSAITAAVVGVIANLALWFGLPVLFREIRRVELLGLAPAGAGFNRLAFSPACGAAMIAMLRFAVGMTRRLRCGRPPAVAFACLSA